MKNHSRHPALCVLCLSVVTLLWRLLDFFDEAIAGSVKMSLGPLLITGFNAVIAQIVIITILLFVTRKSIVQLLRN